jgi:hypothetical protein
VYKSSLLERSANGTTSRSCFSSRGLTNAPGGVSPDFRKMGRLLLSLFDPFDFDGNRVAFKVRHRIDSVNGEWESAGDFEISDRKQQGLWRRPSIQQLGYPVAVVHRRCVGRQHDAVVSPHADVPLLTAERLSSKHNRKDILANGNLGVVVVVNVDLGGIDSGSHDTFIKFLVVL